MKILSRNVIFKGEAEVQILKNFRGLPPLDPAEKARFVRLIAKTQVPIFCGRYPKSSNPTVARFEKRIFQSCFKLQKTNHCLNNDSCGNEL